LNGRLTSGAVTTRCRAELTSRTATCLYCRLERPRWYTAPAGAGIENQHQHMRKKSEVEINLDDDVFANLLGVPRWK
jgi:hypothetical protein